MRTSNVTERGVGTGPPGSWLKEFEKLLPKVSGEQFTVRRLGETHAEGGVSVLCGLDGPDGGTGVHWQELQVVGFRHQRKNELG